jgi:hypothetical protein
MAIGVGIFAPNAPLISAGSGGGLAGGYESRVVADGGAVTSPAKTNTQTSAVSSLSNPVIYLMNGFKVTGTDIDKWYSLYGNDGVGTTATRPVLTSTFAGFDGTNDFIELAHSASQLLTTGGTLMAWVKPDGLGATNGRFIDKSDALLGINGYYISTTATNQILFQINSGTILLSSANATPIGQWSHVAVVFTSLGVSTIYANGISVGTGTTGIASGITTTSPLRVGNRALATDRAFGGLIDALFVSAQQLTVTQVLEYYNATASLYV